VVRKVYKGSYLIKDMERVICRVRQNKTNKQKQITIPKDSEIKAGDYVEVILVN